MEDVGVDPAFWRGRRVLLTGHTGFKGSWLCLWLQALGAEVVGYSGAAPTHPSLHELARVGEGMTGVEGDIRDLEALAGTMAEHRPEVVVHMAAQPIVRRAMRAPVSTYEVNVMGTVNVLEAVRLAGSVRVVVNVTTDKCYRNREWEWGYRETEAMGGSDPYSSSKACSELVTAAYRASFFSMASGGAGTAVATARAGNVIGGGDWGEDRLIPDAMRAALDGRPVRVRNPNAIRPWQHVLNPLSGYLALAQSLWEDRANADGWNFGPEDRDARPVGAVVGRLAELWGEGLTWEHDGGAHPHEAHYLKLDSSRARARLGWVPTWGLERALTSIVAWYRALEAGEDLREVSLEQIRAFEEDLRSEPPGLGGDQRPAAGTLERERADAPR
ncbi:MAG: CDP-glucose 4,6-dehydratase [Thermoleophilaceae bacterium]